MEVIKEPVVKVTTMQAFTPSQRSIVYPTLMFAREANIDLGVDHVNSGQEYP